MQRRGGLLAQYSKCYHLCYMDPLVVRYGTFPIMNKQISMMQKSHGRTLALCLINIDSIVHVTFRRYLHADKRQGSRLILVSLVCA